MNRADLVMKLKKVEAALSTKDLVPVLTCFCFNGSDVYAYDDTVAIRVPCNLEFKGGVRGDVLLPFLQASKAEAATVAIEGGEAVWKVGRSDLRQPVVLSEDFVFTPPSVENAISIPVIEQVIQALDLARVSMGKDPAHPWRLGVTLHFSPGMLSVYSSDNFLGTKIKLEADWPEEYNGKVIVLPPRFVELFVALAGKEKGGNINATQEWVSVLFESGVELFARCVLESDVSNYEQVFGGAESLVLAGMRPIPDGFSRCLERAQVVFPANAEKRTKFTVSSGVLRMHTQSPLGEVKDSLKLPEHADVSVISAPDLLVKALPYGSQMCFTSDSVAVRSDATLFLIRTFSAE